MLMPLPLLLHQGVRDVDAEDVAASPARQVPQLGWYADGSRVLKKLDRPSSTFEAQKFASRLVSAARVIVFACSARDKAGTSLPPDETANARVVATELLDEWGELLDDGRQLQSGGRFAPERVTRHTPTGAAVAEPAARAHKTRAATAERDLPRELLARLLLALYSKRRFTGATAPVYGHRDAFGNDVADGLENKMTIVLEEAGWLEGPRLHDLPRDGPLPPGALGYVRVKAATICRAGRDLEFHQLAGAVHLAADGEAWLAREAAKRGVPAPPLPTRGVWDADGVFQPVGAALADWWRNKSAVDRRLFLLGSGRPAVLGQNGLYLYFGPAAAAAAAASNDDE